MIKKLIQHLKQTSETAINKEALFEVLETIRFECQMTGEHNLKKNKLFSKEIALLQSRVTLLNDRLDDTNKFICQLQEERR